MSKITVRSILLLLTVAALFGATPSISLQTRYIPLGVGDQSVAITADASGNVFVLSKLAATGGTRVTKTDPQGKFLASIDVDTFGEHTVAGYSVDPQGNLVLGGPGTDLQSAKVIKLDNTLTQLLGSATFPSIAPHPTGVGALATDMTGNVYVTGSTADPSFPATPGAYQTTPPANGQSLSFVMKLTPDLGTILYSTFFGKVPLGCVATGCTITSNEIAVDAIAVNAAGIAIMACGCSVPFGFHLQYIDVFPCVARLSADGSSLEAFSLDNVLLGATTVAMAVDAEGDVILAGWAAGFITLTGNPVQSEPPQLPVHYFSFIVEIDSTLQGLVWGTYLGGGGTNLGPGIAGIALDPDGNIWAAGKSPVNQLPGTGSSSTATSPYVAEISPDGSTLLNLILTDGLGGDGIASTGSGGIAVLGSPDSFLLSGPPDQPSLLTVTNSANGASSGTIAPLELVSLFGAGIGPSTAISGQVVDGIYTNELDGYQVLFNGEPAPILYAGPNQINVVSPAAISGQQAAAISVVGPSGTTSFPTVFVGPSRPQLFSRVDPPLPQQTYTQNVIAAIAFNQDGTLNSRNNPAQPGSTATLFATGLGLTGEQRTDGSIDLVSTPYQTPAVTATMPLLSVGDAPGSVFGVARIVIQLSAQEPGTGVSVLANSVGIRAGGVAAALANIYVAEPIYGVFP